jgi:serine/threonine-protein phosphatase 5
MFSVNPSSAASDAGSESSVGSAAAAGGSQATQQEIERADELKDQGNVFFKNRQFSSAVKAYTEAIDLHSTAVLYGKRWHWEAMRVHFVFKPQQHSLFLFPGNRAFAHLKMENFGSAIADADDAIRIDADYLKVCMIT